MKIGEPFVQKEPFPKSGTVRGEQMTPSERAALIAKCPECRGVFDELDDKSKMCKKQRNEISRLKSELHVIGQRTATAEEDLESARWDLKNAETDKGKLFALDEALEVAAGAAQAATWQRSENAKLRGENAKMIAAVVLHHSQKADDRCWMDDDLLYVAFGLPPVDRRVGDKAEMLANCSRFIIRRCEGGGWPTYVELEKKVVALEAENARLRQC